MIMLFKNATLLHIIAMMIDRFNATQQIDLDLFKCLKQCLNIYDIQITPGKN